MNWATAHLGNVLPIAYGKGLTSKARNPEGNVPVVGSSGAVGVHDAPYTGGPALVIGRKGNVGSVYFSQVPCWPIDTVYFTEGTPSTFLPYFSHLLAFLDLSQLDKSTAIPGLSRDDYNAVEAPIPPLSEQHRIVEAIDSYFTRLDDAVASLERAQRNLKRYRASVLKAAVEGRLVPTESELARAEGRDYEPASVLLERILAERRRRWEEAELAKLETQNRAHTDGRWKSRYRDPASPKCASLPALPEGWCWSTLDQLAYYTVDYRGKTPPTASEGVPVISAANVKGGRLVFRKPKFVSPETYARHAVRGFSAPGDLIVTTEAPVGEVALFPLAGTYLLTRRVIGLQTAQADNRYLSYCFSSDVVARHLHANNRGTTVPRILKPALLATPIPLPPLEEQRRIAVTVERHLSSAEAVDTEAKEASLRSIRLRQAILKWAFEGKLVGQDPADEPASQLLERIQAERETTNGHPNRKPRRRRARSPRA